MGLWLGTTATPVLAQALTGGAYHLADLAYQRQAAGDLSGALRLVEDALILAPEHPRLLALHQELLFASGVLDRADELNRHLLSLDPENPRLRIFRVYLLQRQGQTAAALAEAQQVLQTPTAPTDIQRQARLASADLLQALGRPAEALSVLEPVQGKQDPTLPSRLAFLHLAAGHLELAIENFEAALAQPREAAQRRTLLHGLCDAARAAKQPNVELTALEQLHTLDPADSQASLDLAYALLARQQDAEALHLFAAVLRPGSPAGAWLDAAYAAKRLGHRAEAIRFFSEGLDARDRAGIHEPERDFALRREVESLSRDAGLVFATTFRQGSLLPEVASQQKIVQEGLEAYWQPEILSGNGRNVQLFAQAFESLYSRGDGPIGGSTLQGSVGVRVKPLVSQNLVITAQKLLKMGQASLNDWLFRAACSWSGGQDLQPGKGDWPYWNLYTEGDSFAKTGHYIHQLELRVGHAWALPLGSTTFLAPHVVVAGDYDNRLGQKGAGGAGLGTSLRHWFRQDRHHAPASWIELTLQARAQVAGASRAGGLFVTLTTSF